MLASGRTGHSGQSFNLANRNVVIQSIYAKAEVDVGA